jgi:calcineurin-like phosphoesterase family protein
LGRFLLVLALVVLATPASSQGATYTFIGAGDIATSGSNDTATAKIILGQGSNAVVWTAGDNAYNSGTLAQYRTHYAPTWGQFYGRTWPTPGNHEYRTPGAAGYFDYFRARIDDQRYYYKDFGQNWRVYFLNSEIAHGVGSAQYNWLQSKLAAAQRPCTIAIWHKPLFTSGTAHAGDTTMRAFWQLLWGAKADLILNGHNHQYERFAKQRPDGTSDVNGVREVVVGTGGAGLYRFGTPKRNSQVRNATSWGVLRLSLDDDGRSYSGRFLPKAGQTFTDNFSSSCSP